jgi:P27 family predicted phage terminase small subunit
MGMKGPAPTPRKILEARGSWRADLCADEVQFPPGKPTCPAWLDEEARAEWRKQVKQLDAAGILFEVDGAVLAAYCEAWGEFRMLAELIKSKVKKAPDTGYQEAINQGLVNAKNRAVERLVRLAGQFGFSPAARARVKGPQGGNRGEDEGKARYFAG